MRSISIENHARITSKSRSAGVDCVIGERCDLKPFMRRVPPSSTLTRTLFMASNLSPSDSGSSDPVGVGVDGVGGYGGVSIEIDSRASRRFFRGVTKSAANISMSQMRKCKVTKH